jgi:flagellar hook protein FlgE
MAVGSFSAGLTGLSNFSSWLGVIGNNLANINTVGYKGSTVTFQDLVSQTVSGSGYNPKQVGLGVATASVSPTFSQGSIEASSNSTDVAIQGSGFFVISTASGTAYTRAGNFGFDENGVLITAEGNRVQGWTTTDANTGKILTSTAPSDIIVSPGMLRAPTATSSFSAVTNLNADAAVGSTFTSSTQIYDSLGTEHTMTLTYTKTASNTWTFSYDVPGADVTGGTAGTPYALASGTLTFDADGVLSALTPTAPATGGGTAPAIADMTFTTPTWSSGAAASTLTYDLVDGTGAATLSGYAAKSATSSISQNGAAAGSINSISVSADGTISAAFSNGSTVALAQLSLANFNNPQGLTKLGGNLYGVSGAAGLPNLGEAGTGGRGSIVGSALEQSNVDIAKEFTSMILAQRGYQANSKTITTSDELLQETLNLKR